MDKISQICNYCKEEINETKFVSTDYDIFYHTNHFLCCDCATNLSEAAYYEKDKKIYCQNDFHKHFSPVCFFCNELIKEQYISAMGNSYHKNHFKCFVCSEPLSTKFYRKDDQNYCENCYSEKKAKICFSCDKPILDNIINTLNKSWHSSCFVCKYCNKNIDNQSFTVNNENLYHVLCYKEEFFEKCFLCGKFCENEYYQAEGKSLHQECLDAYLEYEKRKEVESKKPVSLQKIEEEKIPNEEIELKEEKKAQEEENIKIEIKEEEDELQRGCSKDLNKDTESISSENVNSENSQKIDEIRKEIERIKEEQFQLKKKKREEKEKKEEEYYLIKKGKNKNEENKEVLFDESLKIIPYSLLVQESLLPKGLDFSKKEIYLSDEEFQTVFKMNKSQFAALPKWRQVDMKKKTKLF